MARLRISIGAAAVLAAGPVLLDSATAAAGGPWAAEYFPNVPLTTQDGTVVHFYDDLLKGNAVVINLIYTRCSASCPLETAKLVQVQRLLGDRVGRDVFLYSISIDPKHDTPEVLKAYAERFHLGPGWRRARQGAFRQVQERPHAEHGLGRRGSVRAALLHRRREPSRSRGGAHRAGSAIEVSYLPAP